MAKFFRLPFALTGDRTSVPDATQPDGSVSYNEGYGQDYSRPRVSDPLAKNIERIKMNQLFYDLTNAVRQYQTVGFPDFISTSDNDGSPFPYEKGATVRWNNGTTVETYLSLTDNNTELPSNAANWVIVTGLIQAAQIGSNQVTLAKLQQLAANTILANPTNATANVQAMSVPASTFFGRLATGDAIFMSVAQAKTLLAIAPADVAGLASGSNSNQYSLHANGSGGITYRNDWLGDVLLANSTDFNTAIDPGRYRFLGSNTHANRPFTTLNGFVDVYRDNGTTVVQLAWAYNGTTDFNQIYKRVSTNSGSSWSAWTQVLGTANLWSGPQRGAPVSVASAATITLDLAAGNNFIINPLNTTANLANPLNQVPGQSGVIVVVAGGAGYNFSFGNNWQFPKKLQPALTGTSGAVDIFGYYVWANGLISLNQLPNVGV